jgi:hypothetical protein
MSISLRTAALIFVAVAFISCAAKPSRTLDMTDECTQIGADIKVLMKGAGKTCKTDADCALVMTRSYCCNRADYLVFNPAKMPLEKHKKLTSYTSSYNKSCQKDEIYCEKKCEETPYEERVAAVCDDVRRFCKLERSTVTTFYEGPVGKK